MHDFRVTAYGQTSPKVRFLEDQDGTAAWISPCRNGKVVEFEIEQAFENFKEFFRNSETASVIRDGFHFVDIPLCVAGSGDDFIIPQYQMKIFLTDLEDTRRLLEIDEELLDSEPCGVLDVVCVRVASGRDSKFLPEVSVVMSFV
jgi:hypothetical protein